MHPGEQAVAPPGAGSLSVNGAGGGVYRATDRQQPIRCLSTTANRTRQMPRLRLKADTLLAGVAECKCHRAYCRL